MVVVGAGGNIGSHLVAHLGRMTQVGRITLIDKDAYEPGNLLTQDIAAGDIGKPKATVQAQKLKRICPTMRVEVINDAVERIPLGKLRSDVILSCLDSRSARQRVNQFAWRLGVPLIDAGVEAGGLLARVNVYVPGNDNSCMECAWDDRDYDALEQTYPCSSFVSEVAPTNAPSSLGALAASLQAIECRKLLCGQTEFAAINRQVLLDAAHHKHYVTTFRRNPQCRFAGHEIWRIQKLARAVNEITLAEALGLACGDECNNACGQLRIEGKSFVTRLSCPSCGAKRSLLRLECSLRNKQTKCRCGRTMIAAGFDALERLSEGVIPENALGRTLRSVGLRSGEVFSVTGVRGEFHFEVD